MCIRDRVWNCSDHKLITTLGRVLRDDGSGEYENVGHAHWVLCLTAHDGKLYSGSFDSTIKVWNLSTNKLITTLRGHTANVSYLTIDDGKRYSRSWDMTIKIWNCSDRKLIATLKGHTPYVKEFLFLNGKLYSKDNVDIKIWKL